MGFNSGKVFLIVLGLVTAGLIYIFTQKEMIDAVSLWISDVLSHNKIEITAAKVETVVKKPEVITLNRPEPKANAQFKFKYRIHGKDDMVLRAVTMTWKILAIDDSQITWESEDHEIESYARNPFLPPLKTTPTPFTGPEQLDYLTTPDIFPLSNTDPKAVQIQDRTWADSQPYQWSCLISSQENLKIEAGEFPVDVVTCLASGGKSGTEIFRYSRTHGHWIQRERNGFGLPKVSVELVGYQE